MILICGLMALLTCQTTFAFNNVTVEEEAPDLTYLTSGNTLWKSLVDDCQKPTMACVERNMYKYLRDVLDSSEDLQVGLAVKVIKNQVDYDRIVREYEDQHKNDSTIRSEDRDLDDALSGGIEEMARSLHDRSMKFLMTHDVEVQLPEAIFDSTMLRLSPRSFADNGALVELNFLPKEREEGRLFKKIKKFISEKLIYALLAILLVIKLLAAKFMFFMPMVVGAVAAKKLLIKVLLFLFPALKWLFKLCPYSPYGGKFHHHKHQISHIHHIGGPHHGPPHHGPPHHGPAHGAVEVIAPHADGPPSLHHHFDGDTPHKPSYNPDEQELEYYSGGPALSYHLSTHRQDEDENEVSPWGQGNKARKKAANGRPLTPSELEKAVAKAEKEALLKTRLQQERLRIQHENARLQEQLRQALKLQDRLRVQAALVKNRVSHISSATEPKLSPPPPPVIGTEFAINPPASQIVPPKPPQPVYLPQQQYRQPVNQQPQLSVPVQEYQEPPPRQPNVPVNYTQNVVMTEVKKQVAFQDALQKAASITYDPFYSPILDKIDKILDKLNFSDEPCRERLICSMYKNPIKFSPHSNLLSAELSRDSSELEKPKTTNAAVIRFYRYVQAARDGQDKRECLRLYAACHINTEQ